MIEDKDSIPSRAYKPVIVLVSDGHPTDDWQGSFARLANGERSSKATRFAMAIGADADESMLGDFANDRRHRCSVPRMLRISIVFSAL
ncbi:vWA domain-containing protein [Pseudomonas aeruginosa]|uniref:vWA domain-containing protein n=1 Tax=Pseudomonas aeruginosa TaxID=287 RepID=UPI001E3D6786|nr:hypothetical protein [Pseudomonas aeruginosa]